MKSVTIIYNDNMMQLKHEGDFTDSEILDLLLAAYTNIAGDIVRLHKCTNPKCTLIDRTKRVVTAIQYENQQEDTPGIQA